MSIGLRLRGVGMALTPDAGGRVGEGFQTGRCDPFPAPFTSPVCAGIDPFEGGSELTNDDSVGGSGLVRDRIHGRERTRLELSEDAFPLVQEPLEFRSGVRHVWKGDDGREVGHDCSLGTKKAPQVRRAGWDVG